MSDVDASGAAPELLPWRVERVLYDQDGLLVVNKPAGLVVHGGDEELEDDCIHRLSQWRKQSGLSGELYVHQRLDQPTSGALFFLTDEKLNAPFAQAMEAHAITREYLVVVELASRSESPVGGAFATRRSSRGSRPAPRGRDHRFFRGQRSSQFASRPEPARWPLDTHGDIELYLLHERGRSRVVSSDTPQSKRALTHYRVLERHGHRALVEVKLSTGRPHQIRATLAHLGTPVVGDILYGGRPYCRLMLHARAIEGGPLPCRFEAPVPLEFEHYRADKSPALSSLSNLQIADALADAAMKRAKIAGRSEVFRLVNGEPDGLPGCTVDAYGAFACINPYDESIDVAITSRMAAVLSDLGFAGVYVKQRVRADLRKQDAQRLAPEQPVVGRRAPELFTVVEQGMRFGIELHDGLSTGLFVDMRHCRAKVEKWLSGYAEPRVLNLFCYTCSFSVAGALSGAHTTSVDLSGRALQRGRANFELNGLDPARHRFFKEDALKYLKKAVRRGDQFELIVLDPPSFATVGKATFSVTAHYLEAAADCFRLLAPGGRLLCVTNHLKTRPRQFQNLVEEAAGEAGRSLNSLRSVKSAPECPDHASGPFPSKAVLATVI